MTSVIAFLDLLGKNPALAHASNEEYTAAEYTAAVDALDLAEPARQALLARDAAGLNELLGGRSKMICALFPVEDDNKKDDEDQPADDQDQKKESIRQHRLN
jgi:hypothetical protein